jgi:thiol-disulfide isomerase/thioredoxin
MSNFTSITDSDFNREVTESFRPVLVYFWAEWCKECKPLMRTVQTVSAEMGARVKIVLLNVDENPRSTRLHCIRMVPTLILFISGEERERIQGLTNRAHLSSTIEMQLQDELTSHPNRTEQLESEEKDLVESQPVQQDIKMHNKDKPVRDTVFISYSRRDTRWIEMVKTHLKPFERDGRIKRWDDTEIKSGQLWKTEIEKAIGSAQVVVLLVSPEFLASDFIANNELPPLLVAAETEGATILSVIIKPCNYAHAENISKYQAINPPDKALAKMTSARRDEVLSKLTERILEVLKTS